MTTTIRSGHGERVIIIGIGNKLMRDDGFGPRIVELLEASRLPSNVEIRDFGTAGITVATDLKGYDWVIFVDAMQRGGDPGTVYREDLTANEVENLKPEQEFVRLSLHEARLEELLSFAKAIGSLPPRITVFGCEPMVLEPGIGLSFEVEQTAQRVARLIVEGLDVA